MNAVEAPEVVMRSIHPGVMKSWRWGNLITTAVLFGFALIIDLAVLRQTAGYPLPPAVGALLLAALVFVIGQSVVTRQHEAWRYALRPSDLLVTYGVVWRTRRCVPRVRVQHVDIQSGPIDRALGLVHLAVFTAGSAGAVISIPGLEPNEAEALKNELLGLNMPA